MSSHDQEEPGREARGATDRSGEPRGGSETGPGTRERPDAPWHELPTAVPVGEYCAYYHGGRLSPDERPPPRGDRPPLLTTDEFLTYAVDAREGGPHVVRLRVAAAEAGSVGVAVDGEPRTRAVVEPTGGWDRWTEVRCRVDLTRGRQTLRLVALSGGWRLGGLRVE